MSDAPSPFPSLPTSALVAGALPDAVLLVDKPKHWTSFDAVRRLRGITKVSKIGHTGTLDPLATGLLICCTGTMTKRAATYQGMPKTYLATLFLGATTSTYDAAAPLTNMQSCDHITNDMVVQALGDFRGTIMQVPPAFSAIKVAGKRSYSLARRGKGVALPPRQVVVHTLELMDVALPYVCLRVVCGKGTYVRSLAHDLGVALGVGAYLSDLQRIAVGSYYVSNAMKLTSTRESNT